MSVRLGALPHKYRAFRRKSQTGWLKTPACSLRAPSFSQVERDAAIVEKSAAPTGNEFSMSLRTHLNRREGGG